MTDIIERPMTDEEKAERAKWKKEQPAREKAQAEELRRQGYQTISDPVYFQWQRGEKTEQDYLDAVAQVKKDYPIPGEDDE
jgi:chorismate mutase